MYETIRKLISISNYQATTFVFINFTIKHAKFYSYIVNINMSAFLQKMPNIIPNRTKEFIITRF